MVKAFEIVGKYCLLMCKVVVAAKIGKLVVRVQESVTIVGVYDWLCCEYVC